MTRYDIRKSTEDDVLFIAANMRKADADEVWALDRSTPLEALRVSYLGTRVPAARTATADGVPFCMFGVAGGSLLSGDGKPWMLSTGNLPLHSRKFLRGSIEVAAGFLESYSFLRNYVDARNTVAIRWLQWVGFLVYYPAVPYGAAGELFHKFEMRR